MLGMAQYMLGLPLTMDSVLYWSQLLHAALQEHQWHARHDRILAASELALLSGCPFAEGCSLLALWSLADSAQLGRKLPEALRPVERQLCERIALRAHQYVFEQRCLAVAWAWGNTIDPLDEFIRCCEMQLHRTLTTRQRSRMLQAYHTALGEKALSASHNQTYLRKQATSGRQR